MQDNESGSGRGASSRPFSRQATMKLFLLLFLVLCAVIAIEGVPKSLSKPPKCNLVCTADYKPVCGGDPTDKSVRPRLFSNSCIMEAHNCENSAHLVEVSSDQCQKVGGIRLS